MPKPVSIPRLSPSDQYGVLEGTLGFFTSPGLGMNAVGTETVHNGLHLYKDLASNSHIQKYLLDQLE